MIRSRARYAYAQARLQARHGERPDERTWARFAAVRDLGAFLDAARRTSLLRYLDHITRGQPIHAMEQALRAEWAAYVAEVASWYPEDWRPALGWMTVLPLMPALDHLRAGGQVLPWMREDGDLAPLFGEDGALSREALHAHGLTCLTGAQAEGKSALSCWLAHWAGLRPADRAEDMAFAALARALVAGGPSRPAALVRRPRGETAEAIAAVFRKHPRSVAAGVAHLLLVALDLERLRGELAVRALLPEPKPREAAA